MRWNRERFETTGWSLFSLRLPSGKRFGLVFFNRGRKFFFGTFEVLS